MSVRPNDSYFAFDLNCSFTLAFLSVRTNKIIQTLKTIEAVRQWGDATSNMRSNAATRKLSEEASEYHISPGDKVLSK